ncbi:hypothetical protein [Magnetovibrio blakemorei]|uniref:DUF4258 domain-containing protein n=1 Tax=Magnetovibrio blakemorei TaxID=28181 RepID=A0A1E5Q347_9PROT|nr:hypothetical protein [Magnetovibrio blakemorei]OEJ63863.1 hypothetical protein BEN30_17060 [Magnetovibrio blakemorei]
MKNSKFIAAFPANDNIDIRCASSKHASKNYRRRGVVDDAVQAILIHGDLVACRGGGVTLIQISKKKLREMGGGTPEGVQTDRLKNLCLLVANDNTIVTAVHPSKGKYKIGRRVEG